MALSKILASLVDGNGQIAIPGVLEDVKPISKEEKSESLYCIPDSAEEFRKQCGWASSSVFTN